MFDKHKRKIAAPGHEIWVDKFLTETNVKALKLTPITLVAAPKTGYHLIFCGALIHKPANTDAYAAPGAGDDLSIQYTDENGLAVGGCETTGVMDQTTVQTRWVNRYNAASANSAIVPVTASPLILCILANDIVDGNGLLHVRTFYKVLPDAI